MRTRQRVNPDRASERVMVTSAVVAEQPAFPLLQDGGPRSAFVGGSYRTCLEQQRAANASLSTPELGAFCLCYGRSLADLITGGYAC